MSISNNYAPVRLIGNGTNKIFSGLWAVLNPAFLRVYLENTLTGAQVLVDPSLYTLVYDISGNGFTVTFITAPSALYYVVIARSITQDQQAPYKTSLGYQGLTLEQSLDKLTAISQEVQEQVNRAIKLPLGSTLNPFAPAPNAGKALIWDPTATFLVNSTDNFNDVVTNATAQAVIATNSANTATGAAGTATTQAGIATGAATSATNSVTAIAAMLNGLDIRDTVFLSFASSPYNVTQADNGKMFVVDTSGGNFVFNLPTIASLVLPFIAGFEKDTADANTVTINRGGTDVIDQTTSKTISAQNGKTLLRPDTDPAPDRWTSYDYGAAAGQTLNQNFVAGIGFAAGTGNSVTITNTPIAATSSGLGIFFDGIKQHGTEWTYNNTTGVVTFNSNIPYGVQNIFCEWGTALPIGTPGAGTVNYASIVSGAFATAADILAGTVSKIVNAANLMTFIGNFFGFSKGFFETAEQTVLAGNGVYSVGHTLSITPRLVQVIMRCKTAELGYSVGDEVTLGHFDNATSREFHYGANATAFFATQTGTLETGHKTTSTGTPITAASWRLVFRAWA